MTRTLLGCLALLSLMAIPAFGGETFLGNIVNTDAGTGTTAPYNLSLPDGGATLGANFIIGPRSKISIQATTNAFVCVDSHINASGQVSCSSTTGTLIQGGTLFPSSCGAPRTVKVTEQVLQSDAGLLATTVNYQSCTVACVAADAGLPTCTVFQRIGDEY